MPLFFLIGFMGSGKSHTGKRLADAMDMDFIDMDELIESNEQQSISEIFEEKGEAYFRVVEQLTLQSIIAENENAFISTGGGVPCFFDNIDVMKANGIVIYLRATPTLLYSRLQNETQQRPILAEQSREELLYFIRKKLRQRAKYYNQAHIEYRQTKSTQNVVKELQDYLLKIVGH